MKRNVSRLYIGPLIWVNYIDSAWGYSHENNQYGGKAIKGYKDRVKVSTKLPVWQVKRRRLLALS